MLFQVRSSGSGILGCEFRMLGSGPELRVWDLGFRVQGLGLRVLGLRVWDLGFAFRFWASGSSGLSGFGQGCGV